MSLGIFLSIELGGCPFPDALHTPYALSFANTMIGSITMYMSYLWRFLYSS